MPLKTKRFDAAEIIDSPEDGAQFLGLAFEDGEAEDIVRTFHTVARARGLALMAQEAGISLEALRLALNDFDGPDLATLERVARALGAPLDSLAKPAAE